MAESKIPAEVFCYVGRAPCGHYRYACVDDPQLCDTMIEDISKMLKAGWIIERKPVSWVQAGGLDFCECAKQKQLNLGV